MVEISVRRLSPSRVAGAEPFTKEHVADSFAGALPALATIEPTQRDSTPSCSFLQQFETSQVASGRLSGQNAAMKIWRPVLLLALLLGGCSQKHVFSTQD